MCDADERSRNEKVAAVTKFGFFTYDAIIYVIFFCSDADGCKQITAVKTDYLATSVEL